MTTPAGAVAAAIALYESPELRRYADDLRRRIAMALHNLGDGINPNENEQQPMFNRPEDAEGFLQSRSGPGAEPGVDAHEPERVQAESAERERRAAAWGNVVCVDGVDEPIQRPWYFLGAGEGGGGIESSSTTVVSNSGAYG